MSLFGPYVHSIDPIIGTVFGVHLWWYGLSYSLGFLNIYLWLRRRRSLYGFSMRTVYSLTLFVTVGVLLGGRVIEVAFYEWPFYREHPQLIPAFWLGGMATHGLILGAVGAIALFCWVFGARVLSITDLLVVPAAFILGVGRIGNFIDGQIVGSVTDIWWAVKFPDAIGFRHPVVLYDGAKNLMLIPILLYLGRRRPPGGALTGVFLFLYAFLRIFIDIFREYPTTLWGFATGQALNIIVSLIGVTLLIWSVRKGSGDAAYARREETAAVEGGIGAESALWQRLLFCALVLFSLTMPSDWTQDIPARYAKRHPGLTYSALYPRIDTSETIGPGQEQ